MIIDTHKVKTARKVLKAIQTMIRNRKKGNNNLYLEHYQNCREQGFIIVNFKKGNTPWVGFSENRNSDDIVVYPSVKSYIPTQGMTDDAWKNAKYFQYDEVNKAAKFCIKHLFATKVLTTV